MGKFKFGSKGIQQIAKLDESSDSILAGSSIHQFENENLNQTDLLYRGPQETETLKTDLLYRGPIEPIIQNAPVYVDREIIKEIPVQVIVEKIIEVEKIVEKLIENPELQKKVVLMSKEIENLKQKLALSNENLANTYNQFEKDLSDKMMSVKEYTKELKQDNSNEHNKFKKQMKTMQYCMLGLLVLSIIGMVL